MIFIPLPGTQFSGCVPNTENLWCCANVRLGVSFWYFFFDPARKSPRPSVSILKREIEHLMKMISEYPSDHLGHWRWSGIPPNNNWQDGYVKFDPLPTLPCLTSSWFLNYSRFMISLTQHIHTTDFSAGFNQWEAPGGGEWPSYDSKS